MEPDYLAQPEKDLSGEEAEALELPWGRLVTGKELLFIEQELKALNAGENEFFPLPLCHLLHFDALPCDIYQEDPFGPGFLGQFSLAWPKGRVCPQTEAAEKGFGYLPSREVGQVLHRFLNLLEQDFFLSRMGGLEQIELLTDLLNLWINNFLLNTAAQTAEQYHQGLTLVETLYGVMESLPRPYAALLAWRRSESGTHAHSLNVCLLGLAFIHFLGFTAPMAPLFGLGALLHDIGMIPFARHLVSQEGCLSPEDLAEVKAHPQRGHDLLGKVAGIPREVLLMASQHHENLDGSGYPLGLQGGEIHPWARMLRVIDSYESITAPRPWRAPFPPDRALGIVKIAWKAKPEYDSHFLQFFILFLEAIQTQQVL